MSKEVSTGSIKLYYTIWEHDMDEGEYKFDWVMSNGDESDELFRTEEEALLDLEGRYS